MPDTRSQRGPQSDDNERFGHLARPALPSACRDLCWLLDRGYALPSSLQLTGNRYSLTQRQRLAVARCACTAGQQRERQLHCVAFDEMRGAHVGIDGYNLLITIEAALGGGVILCGRDNAYRDMASLHGTYRHVQETENASILIGETLSRAGVASCRWILDKPIGNSARLKALLLQLAERFRWKWQVDLEFNPDKVLTQLPPPTVVVSSDSGVLDRGARWCNVAREVVTREVPRAFLLDLSEDALGKEEST